MTGSDALGRVPVWLAAVGAAIAIFLIAPSVIVVLMSFSSGRLMTFPPPGFGVEWYGAFFHSAAWTRSAVASLEIAALATALATVLGTLAAFALERHRPLGAGVIRAIILSPMIVPVLVMAVGMFIAFPRLGITAFPGLVAAHTSLGLPFVLISVTAGLHGLDRDLELAARSLGANPLRGFLRITLPLILPSVLVGALLAFVASWDEVVIALFLATPTLRTLPVTMWEQARHTVDPTIAAASSLLTGVTLLILLAAILFHAAGRRTARPAPP